MEDPMQYFRLFFLSFSLIILSFSTGFAQAKTWNVDSVHSNIYFSLDHIFSKVHGRFANVDTQIAFDPQDLATSRFFFKIKVASVDTGEPKRDKHLLSADFFDEGRYEYITFTSNKITDAGNGLYTVAGTLEVKGQPHELVLPLKLAGIKDHPAAKGKEVIGFNGTLSLDRLALHVGNGAFYKMGLVGKDVTVLVTIEALAQK